MKKTSNLLKRAAYALSVLAFVAAPLLNTVQASAAQITNRKVVLGSSAPSASTTYAFTFTVPTATAIQSVDFAACTTPSGTCTPVPGFSSSASSLTAQPTNLGAASGWTVSTATSTSLRLSNGTNATAPTGSQTVGFSGVVNPSALNSTFFFRITTYSGSNWSTGPIDAGNVATSTAGVITVNATVDEALTFTLAAATVTLSPSSITTAAASTGTSTMSASTNAASGYSITYTSPNALKPAGGTALASYSSSPSTPGTEGFGINLQSNTTPAVGAAPTGGTGTASGVYNSANSFSFTGSNTPTQVASSTGPSNTTTYTVSYVANISPLTAPGAYTTTFNYVATPNF